MNKEEQALFLGMLCGDGYLCMRTRKGGGHCYSTEFFNTNLELMKFFDNLFQRVFEVKGNFQGQGREQSPYDQYRR